MAKIRFQLYLLASLIVAGCAGQIPPSGGPVDKTPPVITLSTPSQKELNVKIKSITLEFNKYMSERSVESAIYFPPYNASELSFDWSGSELEITLKKPLQPDLTYILTVGATAQDLRGNSFGKAYNLVFSTGSHIDTGSVAGKVYWDKAQPMTVAAFVVTPDIDTLRPYITLPKYVTQSDDSGNYVLQGLANGKYRLICFDDQMRNFTYAPQVDVYSSDVRDVEISDARKKVDDVDFMPSAEDTTGPQLYSAELTKDGSILLKFSEPVDSGEISASSFTVKDSASGQYLPVRFATRIESSPEQVALRTSTLPKTARTYTIVAGENLRDLASNPISLSNDTVSMKQDSASTVLPSYFFNFRDSTQNVSPYDTLYCQVILPFLEFDTSRVAVSLLDSSDHSLPELLRRSGRTVYSVVTSGLNTLEWYTLKAEFRRPDDSLGGDSTVVRRFRMEDFSALGELQGKVNHSSGKKIVVVAISKSGDSYYTFADAAGKFVISRIPAGEYSIRAYVQHSGQMKYYRGKSYPYRFAEPFGVFPGTVRVRARWTFEGVDINIP